MVWVGLSGLAKCDVGLSSRSCSVFIYIYIFLLKRKKESKINIEPKLIVLV
ncbi:hypothetical protein VPHK120G1_0016 [Vibrio phage K120 g1]